jgi:hypothetical protein
VNFSDMELATDTARVQAGGRSIFEKAADALTAGTAGAVVSGLGSIYNTGVWASNSIFGTQAEELDTAKVLGDVNQNWRTYYEDNKDVIDTVGFIGGSFIPGGLAVKGLNAARAGRGAGVFRSALGYTMHKQEDFLRAGLQQIASEGADVFATLNKNKLLSMAFGAADNVLQTAVFETAAAVAMQRSPAFDKESWADISWDIAKTSLVGGLLGGGIEALWTNKIFRNAGKLVESKARSYDTVVALDKIGLGLGDRAFSTLDDVFNLPKEVFDMDKKLSFKYRMNGKDTPIELDTSQLYDRKIGESTQKGYQIFQQRLTEAVMSDTTVGAPFAKAMMEVVMEGKAIGKSEGEIREQLLTYLGNLHSMHSIGAAKVDFTKDVFYLVPGASLEGAKLPNAQELFSPVRSSSSDKGFRVVGDVTAAKSGVIGTPGVGNTLKEAFELGHDIVFSGKEGKIHVNPASKIFRKVQDNDDEFLRTTFNTRTKGITDTPVATIADVAAKDSPVVNAAGVTSGKYTYQFSTGNYVETLSSIQNTARHLWAANLKDLKGASIHEHDFSLLDRVLEDPGLIDKSTKLRLVDDTLTDFPNTGIRSFILQKKVERAVELLKSGEGALDHRLVSYQLNTEQKWVQDAVSLDFNAAKLDLEGAFRPLGSYSARDNVVMVYKKPPIADSNTPDFATGMLGYNYRKQLAQQQADTAAAAVLGTSGERFLDNNPMALRGKFDATGAGPTGAGFSNAGYDDPGRVWAQNTGSAVNLTQQEFRNAALDPLNPHLAKLISSGNTELGAVLTRLRLSEDRMALWNGNLVTLGDLKKYRELEAQVAAGKAHPDFLQKFGFKYLVKLEPDTYAFLEECQRGHQKWLNRHNQLAAAQGRTNDWDLDALYAPPINTKKVPYFAFVRAQDGRVFASTETAMITAKDPAELRRLAARVEAEHPDLQVIYKEDSELFHKAQGDYEYSKGLNAPQLDPLLRKKGILGDFIPTLEPKAVGEEFIQHIARREDDLVRSAVQVKYGQTFAELQWLSEQYTKAEKSKFGFLGKLEVKTVADPFGDYKRLALNISKKAEYTLWNNLNEFVDAVGTRAYSAIEEGFRRAKAGETTYEDANRQLERVGLRGVFSSQQDYLAAQTGADRSLIKVAVAKGNMLLANITLRLDTANALINVVSTPILLGTEVSAIRQSIKGTPELAAKFELAFQENMPGGGKIPSTVRLLANAVHNYFGPDKRALIDRYQKTIGSIRDDASKFHDMLEDLSLTPEVVPAAWSKKVDAWVEKGASLTGNNSAEQFTRFVASDVMRQITQPVVEAGKMSVKEQNAFISIFVNRVQGNYVSSQRPIMFQGVLGAAIGLFQTYQFNMFQQLFRHIEDRNGKTLAVAAALQSSLFGMNGLPLFDAINTHLIGNANINEGHKDIYSSVAAADKEWGDFAMYGMSAFPMFSDKFPSLYTRGDLNPRHITIVPTSFSQLPVVEGFTRVAKSVWGIGNQMANGGSFGDAMLHGLEHNGISRPLAGLAQVVKGNSTTSQGSLISANNDLLSITTATRLLGAKPMDEAVALNHKFRMVAYQEADKQRIEALGLPIKEKIRDGTLSEEDVTDFAGRYAAAGGRVQSYGAAMQRWMRDANTSVLNTATRSQQSPYAQRLFEVMGGDPLPDYTNTPQSAP